MCDVCTGIEDARRFVSYDMSILRNDKKLLVINNINDHFSLLDLSKVETNDLDAAAKLIAKLLEEAGEALAMIEAIVAGGKEVIDGEVV